MGKENLNFAAIAGYAKEKKELSSLANVLKNYDKIKKLGGKMPKGIVLAGTNGIGKTCFANALINESGLYTIRVAHSKYGDFATYIGDVFKEAAEKKPCIIFFEEFDKLVASQCDDTYLDKNYERFEELLEVMNEYASEDGIFILATANTGCNIDRSLVRSGRIDRTILLTLPNENDRAEIFAYYAKGKQFAERFNCKELARKTPDFTGADIECVMNDAVINAIKDSREEIINKDIEEAIYNKKFPLVEKENNLSDEMMRALAVHESGHATMMLLNPHRNINKVTIMSRGGIRGYAERYCCDDMISINDKYNHCKVALAGKAAEQVFFDTSFDGSGSDISKAQFIIASLVSDDGAYGFEYMRNDIADRGNISEKKLERIETKCTEVFEKAYEETLSAITKHKKLTEMLCEALLEKKVLERPEIEFIWNKYVESLPKEEQSKLNHVVKKQNNEGKHKPNGCRFTK